jgi:hypothetical protein
MPGVQMLGSHNGVIRIGDVFGAGPFGDYKGQV